MVKLGYFCKDYNANHRPQQGPSPVKFFRRFFSSLVGEPFCALETNFKSWNLSQFYIYECIYQTIKRYIQVLDKVVPQVSHPRICVDQRSVLVTLVIPLIAAHRHIILISDHHHCHLIISTSSVTNILISIVLLCVQIDSLDTFWTFSLYCRTFLASAQVEVLAGR